MSASRLPNEPSEAGAGGTGVTTSARMTPASAEAGETTSVSDGLRKIVEGSADILQPEKVFYNNVQVYNRDLSIAMIDHYNQTLRLQEEPCDKRERRAKRVALKRGEAYTPGPLRILEALSATGLRSVRYWNELTPGSVGKIVVNDIDPDAVLNIRENILRNHLDLAHLEPTCADAQVLMLQSASAKQYYDVVDLDPYGTAVPFMEAGARAVRSGGLICMTCTDGRHLSGADMAAAVNKYGVMPLHSDHCHEYAVRIMLGVLARSAAVYNRHIVPLASMSIDFYFRVFVRVYENANATRGAALNQSHVLECSGCRTFSLHPIATSRKEKDGVVHKLGNARAPVVGEDGCPHCGSNIKLAGPIWNGPLHDPEFLTSLVDSLESGPQDRFATMRTMIGRLSICAEEIQAPLYWDLEKMVSLLKSPAMPRRYLMAALVNAGYHYSATHAKVSGFKTDAPARFVWHVFASWAKHSSTGKGPKQGSPGHTILQRYPADDLEPIVFDKAAVARASDIAPLTMKPSSSSQGKRRFPTNPERHWGPKPRAAPAPTATTTTATTTTATTTTATTTATASTDTARGEKRPNSAVDGDGDTTTPAAAPAPTAKKPRPLGGDGGDE